MALTRPLAWLLALGLGTLLILGIGITSSLGARLKIQTPAVTFHFSIAFALLTCARFVESHWLGQPFISVRRASSWRDFASGVAALWFVGCTALSVPVLGLAQVALIITTGQSLMGVLVDSVGLLGSAKLIASRWTYSGVAAMVVGLVIFSVDRINALEPGTKHVAVLFALSLSAGVVLSVEALLSHRTRDLFHTPLGAAWCSSGTAAVVALITSIFHFMLQPELWDSFESLLPEAPVWMYLGGVTEILFLFVGDWLTAGFLSARTYVFCSVVGLLASSLLFDSFGVARDGRQQITILTLTGMVIAFVALLLLGKPKDIPNQQQAPLASKTSQAVFPAAFLQVELSMGAGVGVLHSILEEPKDQSDSPSELDSELHHATHLSVTAASS